MSNESLKGVHPKVPGRIMSINGQVLSWMRWWPKRESHSLKRFWPTRVRVLRDMIWAFPQARANFWFVDQRRDGVRVLWKEDSADKVLQVKRNERQLQREGKGVKSDATTGWMQDIRGGEALEWVRWSDAEALWWWTSSWTHDAVIHHNPDVKMIPCSSLMTSWPFLVMPLCLIQHPNIRPLLKLHASQLLLRATEAMTWTS